MPSENLGLSGVCSPGSCSWCGCHFRRPSDVLYHRCAAMQEAEHRGEQARQPEGSPRLVGADGEHTPRMA